MARNKPVITTAKVRGLIKKNDINYVDATRRNYPSIANGVSVWQLSDSVYFQVFDAMNNDENKRRYTLQKMILILANEGCTIENSGNQYKIVKAVA